MKIILNEIGFNKIVKNLIKEQFALLSLPSDNISLYQGNDTKQIKLSGFDEKTKRNLTLLYNITGKYRGLNFDLEIKNIKRLTNKNLTALVKPSGWIGYNAMATSIPDKFFSLDADGEKWLKVEVPKKQIDAAINQLRQNKGVNSIMDAGYGVKLILTAVN